MFEKYFYGLIEHACDMNSKERQGVVMACYNNDFSLESYPEVKRYSEEKDNVFFAWREYEQESIIGAYDPFLDVICKMYREYARADYDSFDEFLDQCEVYELQREVLRSYFETGQCRRTEEVLAGEIEYEQQRLTKTILLMLKTAWKNHFLKSSRLFLQRKCLKILIFH